jgi:hypothetical protein
VILALSSCGAGPAFMPIVLSLTGRLDVGDDRLSRSDARDWLGRAAVWFEEIGDVVLDAQLVRDSEDRPGLLVVLHPSSPPVEIRLGGSGKVRVHAATTPAGPGYHQYLCGLLRRLTQDFSFEWIADDCVDPTGYFGGRQRAELEQHFLRWLAEQCSGNPRSVGLAVSFSYPAEVLTPLGPRTADWTRAVARDPLCGADFFPWWSADLDHAFYRNRALARLWCDFPWRPPLTEAEGEEADQIANDLATAFKLDPGGELPWAEWLELLAAIQADATGDRFCVTPTDQALSIELWRRAGPPPPPEDRPRLGYRRYPVRAVLDGGWTLEVPGDFAGEWDEERNWTAWNRARTVWFRRVGFTKPGGALPTAAEALEVGKKSLPEGAPAPGINEQAVVGEAVFGPTEDDGRTVYRLSGVAGTVGEIAVCNIYIEDEADRDWAVRTWRTLRHGS